jgi:Ca2+-binding RTX toxin-like protein
MHAGTSRLALQAALLLGLGPLLLAANCNPEPDPGNCTVRGTPFNDRGEKALHGTPGDDVICGFEGNDQLYGYGGNDTLYGGSGADELYGGDDADFLYGGTGPDEVKGQAGDDLLVGGGGADEIRGDGGSDYLMGDTGNDQLFGGADEDWASYLLATGPVSVGVTSSGPDGADTLDGIENIEGSAFGDTLAASGTVRGLGGNNFLVGTTVDYGWASGVEVNLDPGGGQVAFALHGDSKDTLWGVRDIIGSQGDDILRGDEQSNRILGGPGDDQLFGRDAGDHLDGQAGYDFANGNMGNDTCIAEDVENCEP